MIKEWIFKDSIPNVNMADLFISEVKIVVQGHFIYGKKVSEKQAHGCRFLMIKNPLLKIHISDLCVKLKEVCR